MADALNGLVAIILVCLASGPDCSMRNHTHKIERPVASLQECMMASQTFTAEQGLVEPGSKIRVICKTQ